MSDLTNSVAIPTRDTIVLKKLRDYLIRNPGTPSQPVDTTAGSMPYIKAYVDADMVMPLYANIYRVAQALALSGMSDADLTQFGIDNGIPNPGGIPATGSTGLVSCTTSAGGARVVGTDLSPGAGLEAKTSGGIRVQASRSGTYTTQTPITVAANIDTGTQTNLPAGTSLTVTSPPYGMSPTWVVVANADGSGLTGGRAAETTAERVARFQDFLSNPPSAGDDASYQAFVQRIKGLSVQKCFTYPAVDGSGTTGIAFTMQPAVGQSRCPNDAQLTLVRTQLAGAFPGDDGQFLLLMISVPVTLILGVKWTKAATGWADSTPWPVLIDNVVPVVSSVATPSVSGCRVVWVSAPDEATAVGPSVGQTIGFFDPTSNAWKAKRILTATPSTGEAGWDLTFDLTASDPAYVPVSGQPVCPWSDSLSTLVDPIVDYFEQTGPGEMYTTPFDAGVRRLRQPEPPEWPADLDTPLEGDIFHIPAVASALMSLPTLPDVCPTGTPNVSVNLFELGGIAAYPI